MIKAPEKVKGLEKVKGPEKEQRLAKWIAQSGLASRRVAEDWILAGRVSLDGKVTLQPAQNVDRRERINVDGQPLPLPAAVRLFRLHKPRGLLVAERDPGGRATVFDALPKTLPRLHAVGRLDLNSEGLLLLTTDGGFKRRLELPETGLPRSYRVRAFGRIGPREIAQMARGVAVEGMVYEPITVTIEPRPEGKEAVPPYAAANHWLRMTLTEGKNREIRKVLGHFGLQVSRLIRISYGPISLGSLKKGEVREVGRKELQSAFGLGPTPSTGWAKPKARPTRPGQSRPKQDRKTADSRRAHPGPKKWRAPKAF